jgi:hypothetical protein
VGSGTGLDNVEKIKITCPYRESNPGSSGRSPTLCRLNYTVFSTPTLDGGMWPDSSSGRLITVNDPRYILYPLYRREGGKVAASTRNLSLVVHSLKRDRSTPATRALSHACPYLQSRANN